MQRSETSSCPCTPDMKRSETSSFPGRMSSAQSQDDSLHLFSGKLNGGHYFHCYCAPVSLASSVGSFFTQAAALRPVLLPRPGSSVSRENQSADTRTSQCQKHPKQQVSKGLVPIRCVCFVVVFVLRAV